MKAGNWPQTVLAVPKLALLPDLKARIESSSEIDGDLFIVPSFLVTGVLAIIFGLIATVWAAEFVQRKNGGLVLILLSVVLLLVGGGFFPSGFGVTAGIIGTRIKQLPRTASNGISTNHRG